MDKKTKTLCLRASVLVPFNFAHLFNRLFCYPVSFVSPSDISNNAPACLGVVCGD